MKILYCIEGLYNSGGMERIITAKANHFESKGHEVMIATVNQKCRHVFFDISANIKLIDLNHVCPLKIVDGLYKFNN